MRTARHRLMPAAVSSLLIAVVPWIGRPLVAHDLERTEVTLTFAFDGTFVVDVANDPDWLLLRLEPFAAESRIPGRPHVTPARPMSVEQRDALLAAFAPVVIDRVVLWVDGREVRPSSAAFVRPRPQAPADDLPPLGIYRLRGRMPIGVRSLRWFYGIVIDPYPLTIRRADGRELKETVLGKAWSESLDLAGQFERPTRLEVIGRYLTLGVRHVLSGGVDHLLFVFGVLLLSRRVRPAVVQVAAFTVAQSIGLGLAMVGVVAVSARVLWPIAVLSIVYVVVESLVTRRLTPWRIALVFVFGVFHGAELAGALQTIGVPPTRFPSSVLAFTAGVISVELVVVAVVLAATHTTVRLKGGHYD